MLQPQIGRPSAAAGRGTRDRFRKRYFADFCFFLASARRSVFFRRLARFLALSLPLLFPIRLITRRSVAPQQLVGGHVTPSRLPCRSLTKAGPVVVLTKTGSNS